MLRLLRLLTALAILLPSASVALAADRAADAATIRADITAVLDPDTGRDAPRLPRVGIDPTGDLTVIFGMRREDDDPAHIGQGGLADSLTILRAVYQSEAAGQLRTTTVLGTYASWTKLLRIRELPLLRVTVSAATAARLDWDALTPGDLRSVADDFWMQDEIVP